MDLATQAGMESVAIILLALALGRLAGRSRLLGRRPPRRDAPGRARPTS